MGHYDERKRRRELYRGLPDREFLMRLLNNDDEVRGLIKNNDDEQSFGFWFFVLLLFMLGKCTFSANTSDQPETENLHSEPLTTMTMERVK